MSTTSHSPFIREAVRLLASPALRGVARKICPRDFEDVLQDAALRCVEYEQRHPGFEPRSVVALVHVIVRHVALGKVEAGKRKRDYAVQDSMLAHESAGAFPSAVRDFSDDDVEAFIAAAVGTPETEAIEREQETARERQRNFVRLAVAKLPPEQRKEIGSTFWHEIPVRNTRLRGVPFGTAVSRVSRAKAQLRAMPEIVEARRLRFG